MGDSNLLQFDKFLRNSILRDLNSKNKILDIVKTFYNLKRKNEQFILNPKKKVRIIPDFKALIEHDYDEESNPGDVIKTNLPLKFEENNNNLILFIRDNKNTKNIIEININLDSKSSKTSQIPNVKKEMLLYKINSVKNKKTLIEVMPPNSEKDRELSELNDHWHALKTQVEKFTKDYSKFIENENIKKAILNDFHSDIIKNNNQTELINFENNLLISSIINSHTGNVTNTIQYYITIYILISQYNKRLSLITNKPIINNLIGSVVYNKGVEINEGNIFIVTEKVSDSLVTIIDINGNISKVNIDAYAKICDKLKIADEDSVNIAYKPHIDKTDILITKNILDKKFKLKHSGNIQYIETKNKNSNSYNDIDKESSIIEKITSQEVIKCPEYKLIKTLQSLDTLISTDNEGTIYIHPNIFHRDVGEGYINSKKQSVFVKEDCDGCNLNLNKILDWRNKLTKSYINTYFKNGEIIPIIIDKKSFSSVAHYYLYYSNKDNNELADMYLHDHEKGNIIITPRDFESDIQNAEWDKSTNILDIPNYVFELLRATAAKFIQNKEMKNILLGTNKINIINACFEDFSSGEYEISKELLLVRKYLQDDIITDFYINCLDDMNIATETRKILINKHIPQFITVKTDKVIKKLTSAVSSSKDGSTDILLEKSTLIKKTINRKLQLKKLQSYVSEVLGKYIYNVPGDGNCLFYAITCSAYHHNVFESLVGETKLLLDKSLSAELCEITVNDRLKKIPILKQTAMLLKQIVSNIIQYNYNEFLKFFKKNKIPDELEGIEKLEKMDMIIQQHANEEEALVLSFIHTLLLDIEHDRIYEDIDEYIVSIATDANKILSYRKGWGGNAEIKIVSALLHLDITTYPSFSADISDLDEYYSFKYKDTSRQCIIPLEYKMKRSNIIAINIGYLDQQPQHYYSIIDTDDLEDQLQLILEEESEQLSEDSSLQKLLNMGYELEFASNALRLNQNNIDMALNYILRTVQSGVDLLESDHIYNYTFQTNELEVSIAGSNTYISQFHEGSENSYYQDYHFLEITHDYIQWLFPMKHLSVNNPDVRSVLKLDELEIMKENELVKDSLFKSLRTMMDFYGANLEKKYDYSDSEPGYYELHPNDNIKERLSNLNQRRHNSQRISRILNYLNSMGEYKLQYTILGFFIEQIFLNPHKIDWHENIIESVYNYWMEEVSDIDDAIGGFFGDIESYKKRVKKQEDTVQSGGSTQHKPLENNYMMFPFKYRKLTYNIVYVIPNNVQKGGGQYKKTTILGIMHKSGRLMLEKNINKDTVLYKVLGKVSDKIFTNSLRVPKKKFKKLEYSYDITNNNVLLNDTVIGSRNKKGEILFN